MVCVIIQTRGILKVYNVFAMIEQLENITLGENVAGLKEPTCGVSVNWVKTKRRDVIGVCIEKSCIVRRENET